MVAINVLTWFMGGAETDTDMADRGYQRTFHRPHPTLSNEAEALENAGR